MLAGPVTGGISCERSLFYLDECWVRDLKSRAGDNHLIRPKQKERPNVAPFVLAQFVAGFSVVRRLLGPMSGYYFEF